jgi:hypothetical protein
MAWSISDLSMASPGGEEREDRIGLFQDFDELVRIYDSGHGAR